MSSKTRRPFPFSALWHFPKVTQISLFVREKFGTSVIAREPEPDLVMDDHGAVTAFTEAGRPDGPAAAYYLFYTARASLVIQGAKRVLDLGTGPGTQLVQLARLHPSTSFVGLDLSESMLDEARRYACGLGVQNIEFVKGDFTKLDFPDASFDAVTGIMALHHLPSIEDLRRALAEIRRVLRPDGALFFVDFGRLKSPVSMISVAYEKVDVQHILLTRDYERSLRAAFRLEDYQVLIKEFFPNAQVVSTYQVPLLVIIKTSDRDIPVQTLERLREDAGRLDASRRRDLDEIRVFLAFGGLENDPFEGGLNIPWSTYRRLFSQHRESTIGALNTGLLPRVWIISGLLWCLGWQSLNTRFWDWIKGEMDRRKQIEDRKDLEMLGRTLRTHLGSLKGPLMKFGQMASYVDDRVPAEIRKLLSSLQDHSAALSPAKIFSSAEKSLGRPLGEVFAQWENLPLACASISQLHLAQLNSSEKVVVKILYPGIKSAVESDLGLMSILAPWLGRRLHVSNVPELLREAGGMILKECDLSNEAKIQESFRQAFAGDSQVVIPKVYREFSAPEILTMDFVEGRSFSQFMAEASMEEKSRAGEIIARVTVTSLHKHCLFNGDPHPGNYLFLNDGKVAFLDFGFSKIWDKEFINLTKRQALAALEEDIKTFAEVCRLMGYESNDADDYADMLRLLRDGPYRPWLEDKPFRYSREFVRGELLAISEFYRRHGPVRLSVNHLMVHRVFWGHHAIFADLEAEFNLHRVLIPLLRQSL